MIAEESAIEWRSFEILKTRKISDLVFRRITDKTSKAFVLYKIIQKINASKRNTFYKT